VSKLPAAHHPLNDESQWRRHQKQQQLLLLLQQLN
jgi:hypothetical protein